MNRHPTTASARGVVPTTCGGFNSEQAALRFPRARRAEIMWMGGDCLFATGRDPAAQVTAVFRDTFASGNSATRTTCDAIGSLSLPVTYSGTDWGPRINTSPGQLELTKDRGGA
jgi:hypothetical protein